MIENAFAGIVVTAQTFNPSVFTETWLTQNHIIDTSTLVGLRIFSPQMAQFQTSEIQALVIPPKLQITFGLHEGQSGLSGAIGIASRIIESLPSTPFQALGLNFDFFLKQPDNQDFGGYNRALLSGGDCGLVQEFDAPNARFGRHFSKDCGEARLRLDIKPVTVSPDDRELLQFSFNYHHEIKQMALTAQAGKLVELIGKWVAAREYAERLVVMVTGQTVRK